MAKPIGASPVLTGEDAVKFLAKLHADAQTTVGPTPTPNLYKVRELVIQHAQRQQKHVR
jgi:hypothetical protein